MSRTRPDMTMKVEGLKDLETSLLQLGKAIPGVIAKGLKPPMQRVLDAAKALVNANSHDSGALHDALALTPVRRATARRASMADALSEVGIRLLKIVRNGRRPRSYWHLVEFGTSHSAAEPYLRPAFDQNAESMVGEFKGITSAEIDRIHQRFARRRRRGRK